MVEKQERLKGQPGLPDDYSLGELLEWQAQIVPGKWNMIIEFRQKAAELWNEMATMTADEKQKRNYRDMADEALHEVERMKRMTPIITENAKRAREQLDDLR
jgi:hypothetical protein